VGLLWLKRTNKRDFGNGFSVFELSLSLKSISNNNPVALPAHQETHYNSSCDTRTKQLSWELNCGLPQLKGTV